MNAVLALALKSGLPGAMSRAMIERLSSFNTVSRTFATLEQQSEINSDQRSPDSCLA
jgi:hypothetical protein